MAYNSILLGTVMALYLALGHVNGWSMSHTIMAACSVLTLIVGYFSYNTYAEVVRREDFRLTVVKEDAERTVNEVTFRGEEVINIKRFSFRRNSWVFSLLFYIGCLGILAVYMDHYSRVGNSFRYYVLSVSAFIVTSWIGTALSALRNNKMYGIGLKNEYPIVIPHDADAKKLLEELADADAKGTVILDPMQVPKT
jgi:hypothetical protein